MKTENTYCIDDRHGTPCPTPCATCRDEACDPKAEVVAASPIDAMRVAGWSEDYIASVAHLTA